MKWKVTFYTESGKPDKRKPGRSSSVHNERIDELSAAAAMQITRIQEANHLSRPWAPFQRMMDQFNQGNLLDGLTQVEGARPPTLSASIMSANPKEARRLLATPATLH